MNNSSHFQLVHQDILDRMNKAGYSLDERSSLYEESKGYLFRKLHEGNEFSGTEFIFSYHPTRDSGICVSGGLHHYYRNSDWFTEFPLVSFVIGKESFKTPEFSREIDVTRKRIERRLIETINRGQLRELVLEDCH